MRNLMWMLPALTACGTVEIQAEARPCTDVDLGADPELFIEEDGADLLVYRKPVMVGVLDTFQPTFEFESKELHINEFWAAGTNEQESCRMPTVRLVAPPPGEWIFNWYIDGDNVPAYRETYEI